jgi:hypothetical protein
LNIRLLLFQASPFKAGHPRRHREKTICIKKTDVKQPIPLQTKVGYQPKWEIKNWNKRRRRTSTHNYFKFITFSKPESETTVNKLKIQWPVSKSEMFF